ALSVFVQLPSGSTESVSFTPARPPVRRTVIAGSAAPAPGPGAPVGPGVTCELEQAAKQPRSAASGTRDPPGRKGRTPTGLRTLPGRPPLWYTCASMNTVTTLQGEDRVKVSRGAYVVGAALTAGVLVAAMAGTATGATPITAPRSPTPATLAAENT